MEQKKLSHEILPFWDKLSDSEERILIDGSMRKSFEKGMMLSYSDERCKGVMILLFGQIRAYIISDEGREITLYRLHKGDVCVLSASCLMDSIAFDVLIEAIEKTEVILIPSQVLHKVMEKNPYVELYLQKQANKRFSDVMWTMQQILFMGADKRVAIFLWDEMIKTNQTTLFYTHDEIARYIGSAREVVTRVLKYFAKESIVKLSRCKIEIISKEKLKSYL